MTDMDMRPDFKDKPTVANWKSYTSVYPKVFAALWLNFFIRMEMKTLSSTQANQAGISELHYG